MAKQAQLFFVLGAPKSGTTWIQHLLDRHPQIICTGEGALHWYMSEMQRARTEYNNHLAARNDIFQQQAFPLMEQNESLDLARSFVLKRLNQALKGRETESIRWVGNKDPDHGVNMNTMVKAFSKAHYIHIIRDGRDQLVSFWHHMRRHHPNYRQEVFSSVQTLAAKQAVDWAQYIRHVRLHAAEAGVAYHELRYEDLLSKPESTLKALLAFLDIHGSDAELEKCLTLADFRKLSGGRSRGDEDANSFFRKGVSGDWRNYMTDEASHAFCEATDGMMDDLGYRGA